MFNHFMDHMATDSERNLARRLTAIIGHKAPDGAPIEALACASSTLFERDWHLLRHNAAERAISHRLAVYLEPHFAGFHVDCEYNRSGRRPKELLGLRGKAASGEGSRVLPDIVVHRRGANSNNLLIIEMKKSASKAADECDMAKLRAYQCEFDYQYAVFVKILVGSATHGFARLEWITRSAQL